MRHDVFREDEKTILRSTVRAIHGVKLSGNRIRIDGCAGLEETVNRLVTAIGMRWYEKFEHILRRCIVMMWLRES